ncbi:MAG: 3-hydroxybutyryl-CoA dehydrogenase, partial [Frankiales bacterium]|nr:3-hydroxybutyryl-CoA dehydrogenase [Frankiales bacterium]
MCLAFDPERVLELQQAQHPQHHRSWATQHECAAQCSKLAARLEQRPETGHVQELQPGEVEHEPVHIGAVPEQVADALAKQLCGGHVKLAGQLEHGRAVLGVRGDAERRRVGSWHKSTLDPPRRRQHAVWETWNDSRRGERTTVAREFRKVGLVGLGTMGAGIAEVLARSGLDVVGIEHDDAG